MDLDSQSEYPSRFAPRLWFYLSSMCRAKTLHGEVTFISGILPSFLHSTGLYKRCKEMFQPCSARQQPKTWLSSSRTPQWFCIHGGRKSAPPITARTRFGSPRSLQLSLLTFRTASLSGTSASCSKETCSWCYDVSTES